jgi:hypothetical protein
MSSIEQKLDELEALIKADLMPHISAKNSMPNLAPSGAAGRPRGPGIPKSAFAAPQSTGVKPPSQKDPTKVAEQLKQQGGDHAERIKQAKEGIAISTNGQWSIKKFEDPIDKGLKSTIAAGLLGASLMSNPTPKAPQPKNTVTQTAEKDKALTAEQPTEVAGAF